MNLTPVVLAYWQRLKADRALNKEDRIVGAHYIRRGLHARNLPQFADDVHMPRFRLDRSLAKLASRGHMPPVVKR